MTNLPVYFDQLGIPYFMQLAPTASFEEAVEIEPFTPQGTLLPPSGVVEVNAHNRMSVPAVMYETPLSHADQQRQAYRYGSDNLGFRDAVTFKVRWSDSPESYFTVSTGMYGTSWRQEEK